MEAIAAIEVMASEAMDLDLPARGADSETLFDFVTAYEKLGRIVDAKRAWLAAEIARQSSPDFGPYNLSARRGLRGGAEVLAEAARISAADARRRIRVGLAGAEREWADGSPRSPRYPIVARRLARGEIAGESAAIITSVLDRVRIGTSPDQLAIAEASIAEIATDSRPERVREEAERWAADMRPDLVDSADQARYASRSVRIGPTRLDGLTPMRVLMPPEESALVRSVLETHRGRAVIVAVPDASDTADDRVEGRLPVWQEGDGKRRSMEQFDFDTLLGMFTAGLRAETSASTLSSPFEVIVHVDATQQASGEGPAWLDGVHVPISMPSLDRIACTAPTRVMTITDGGERLDLGRSTRLFTPVQKKAMNARDGGCGVPGCFVPGSWCEAHHIRWWIRDNGPTDIANGILLCPYHHHLIHTTDQWAIAVVKGVAYLVPGDWQGTPLPEHRMQRRGSRGSASTRLREGRPRSRAPG